MKILCKNATVLSRIFLCLLRHPKRKQLNIGTWNRPSLMTLTLALMSLFFFQIANAEEPTNQAQATIQHIFPVGFDS